MAQDRTLIEIRERSYLDLMDLALIVIRERPLALGLAALGGIAPWAALDAWLISRPGASPSVALPILIAFQAPWATAPLTIVLSGLMFGERPPVRRVLSFMIRAFWPMLVYQGFLRAVLIFTFLLGPLLPGRLAFLNEVILLERGKMWGVYKRNTLLCGEGGFDLLGQFLGQLAFGVLFVAAAWFGVTNLIDVLMLGMPQPRLPEPSDYAGWLFQTAVWLVVGFFAVVRFLSYIDRRIRLEGWEVELRLRQAGEAMAVSDAEPWQ